MVNFYNQIKMTRKLLTCSSLSRLHNANFYNMDKIIWESFKDQWHFILRRTLENVFLFLANSFMHPEQF